MHDLSVRILLVEDNALHTQLIRTVLSRPPFEVVAVDRLSAAMDALRGGEFAAILLDLELPDSDGLATLEAVLDVARESAIVVITAHDDAEHALQAVSAGAADYLVKGKLDAQTLTRSVRYAIERKRAEQKLLSSEARFRAIIESALEAVVGMNIDGAVTAWSHRAETMFGYLAEEAIGKAVADLIIPEPLREAHWRAIARYRESGAAHSLLNRRVELVAMRRDRSEFPIEMGITSIRTDEGIEFCAFIADITERRRLENERDALNRRFRQLVEHSADGIALLDPRGIVTYSSPAVTRILGYTAEEMLGTNVFALAHPDDLDRARSKFQACLDGASPEVTPDLRFRHRDGSWRYLNVVRSNCLDDPAIAAVVVNLRDMTDLRRSRDALGALKVKYEVILNAAGSGIFGIGIDDRITFMNPAAARMLRLESGDSFEARDLHGTLHPTDEGEECAIRSTLLDGVDRHVAADRFTRRDGTSFPVSYAVAPVRDPNEAIMGAVVSFTDMTRQREMEGQVEQAMRVSSLGRVSATVAHEFNNVLMAIQPFAELLKKRVGSDESVQRPVQHILDAIKRGQRMTTQILRFAKPSEPSMEPVDATEWIRNFGDEARPMLDERHVEVMAGDALPVRVDVMQLHQVFTNLVANARHATAPGDTVTIGALPASEVPFVRERIPDPEHYAVLFVRDSGKGIAPDVLPRIFEALYTTKRGGGTGLGLAVAQQVIAYHKGQILVDSELGRGATFYVALPNDRIEAREGEAHESAHAARTA